MSATTLDQIVSLCKRKGFIYPSSEIYNGFANAYAYGPYGTQLRKNIKDLWWRTFVTSRTDIVGLDGPIIMHPRTWEASGHVGGFSDQLVDCKNCKSRIRADHLVEDALQIDCEGKSNEEVTQIIRDNNLKCPKCGKTDLTDVRQFNLMFQMEMSKTGDEENIVYLRPETAQAMFVEFKNVTQSTRVKVPFGMAQIGKAFRNEITPGNFIFRLLEFEQMEIEFFVMPPENWETEKTDLMAKEHLNDWPSAAQEHINTYMDGWQETMLSWCEMIGLDLDKCKVVEHKAEKLSHYSKRTFDIEYVFPFGQKELYGCAYRTDFDLTQHQEHSGQDLRVQDPQTNEKYLPHVVEPTFGLDRSILAILCAAYDEETLEDGSTRTVMRFAPQVAPVQFAVLPLMKKAGLPEKAHEILQMLQAANTGVGEYDDGGAIGKRYRRQDEIGTPVCITIDFDTLEDDSVTIRHRDSMEQERIKISDLSAKMQTVLA